MKQLKYGISILIIIFIFQACEREELALPAPIVGEKVEIDTTENIVPKGQTISNFVVMDEDYKHQIWFDLGTNSVVSSNLRTDWDLAFDCNLNEYKLYLNESTNASVAFTNEVIFDSVSTDAGLVYSYEHQSGKEAHLAIGDISNRTEVFIVDRGINPAGNSLGKWKVQITLVQDQKYYMTCSKLNGDDLTTAIIDKKPNYNRVAFSFKTLSQIQIEPPKVKYDVVFTQYTHEFVNPPLAYSVNGVLINSYHTEVAEEFNMKFSDISRAHAINMLYSSEKDVIGYDWKDPSGTNFRFVVYPNRNYILKDVAGNLFKLHFLDFYDQDGKKGTPSFEFERL